MLFSAIDKALCQIHAAQRVAYSAIMDCLPKSVSVDHSIIIRSLIKEYTIYISVLNFSPDEYILIDKSFADNSVNLRNILQIVFKKDFTLLCRSHGKKNIHLPKLKQIIVSVICDDSEHYVEFYIPTEIFRLFSKNIFSGTPSEIIESEIIDFFKIPGWMIPDFKYLYTSLDDAELKNLTNLLQRKNLLTPYHIFLLLQAFPELSGIMRKLLSKNTINDVIRYNKASNKLKINRRDMAGAIYSIEESIYCMLRDGNEFFYSAFLSDMQQLIRWSINMELLLKRSFIDWIAYIMADDLLYATVSATEDRTTARAFARHHSELKKLFNNRISENKINDILQMAGVDFTFEEILRSQITFILNYRKIKIKKIKAHPDRLEYLLACFSDPRQYQYLLFSVGWFILSTAMKGFLKINIDRVLINLPASPRILIEDVLQGIVNPNILHDEMQINKAKKICVDAILRLYIDGMIHLDL